MQFESGFRHPEMLKPWSFVIPHRARAVFKTALDAQGQTFDSLATVPGIELDVDKRKNAFNGVHHLDPPVLWEGIAEHLGVLLTDIVMDPRDLPEWQQVSNHTLVHSLTRHIRTVHIERFWSQLKCLASLSGHSESTPQDLLNWLEEQPAFRKVISRDDDGDLSGLPAPRLEMTAEMASYEQHELKGTFNLPDLPPDVFRLAVSQDLLDTSSPGHQWVSTRQQFLLAHYLNLISNLDNVESMLIRLALLGMQKEVNQSVKKTPEPPLYLTDTICDPFLLAIESSDHSQLWSQNFSYVVDELLIYAQSVSETQNKTKVARYLEGRLTNAELSAKTRPSMLYQWISGDKRPSLGNLFGLSRLLRWSTPWFVDELSPLAQYTMLMDICSGTLGIKLGEQHDKILEWVNLGLQELVTVYEGTLSDLRVKQLVSTWEELDAFVGWDYESLTHEDLAMHDAMALLGFPSINRPDSLEILNRPLGHRRKVGKHSKQPKMGEVHGLRATAESQAARLLPFVFIAPKLFSDEADMTASRDPEALFAVRIQTARYLGLRFPGIARIYSAS